MYQLFSFTYLKLLKKINVKHYSQEKKMFPVKLTEPLTAILYIASDLEHIEELRHSIHVKEVIEGLSNCVIFHIKTV